MKELRAWSCSLGTTLGRNVELATEKSTSAKLMTSATTTSCATVSASSHQATGTDATASARTRSMPTWSRRSGSRWVNTPAGRPMTSQATYADAAITPISKGVASSTSSAVSGSATAPTADPTALVALADQ